MRVRRRRSIDYFCDFHSAELPLPFKQIPRGLLSRQPPLEFLRFSDPSALENDFERALVQKANGDARPILVYLRFLAGDTGETLRELKCMFTGHAAAGKTTLVRALRGEKDQADPLSTDGIDLGSIQLNDVTLHTWDFGGQEVYHYTHQLFLSENAVYLVLFRLNEPTRRSLKQVKFWLDSIVARTRGGAVVLLVGTHADRVPADEQIPRLTELVESVQRFYSNQEVSFHTAIAVSPKSGHNMKALREAIYQASQRALPRVPSVVAIAKRVLESMPEYASSDRPPVMNSCELQRTLSIESAEYWETVVFGLEALGAVIRLKATAGGESEKLVVRPQWLTKVIATIVTTKFTGIDRNGELDHKHLKQIWNEKEFPEALHEQMLALLRDTEVLFPIEVDDEASSQKIAAAGSSSSSSSSQKPSIYQGRSLVPCLMPEQTPDEANEIFRIHNKQQKHWKRVRCAVRSGGEGSAEN